MRRSPLAALSPQALASTKRFFANLARMGDPDRFAAEVHRLDYP